MFEEGRKGEGEREPFSASFFAPPPPDLGHDTSPKSKRERAEEEHGRKEGRKDTVFGQSVESDRITGSYINTEPQSPSLNLWRHNTD